MIFKNLNNLNDTFWENILEADINLKDTFWNDITTEYINLKDTFWNDITTEYINLKDTFWNDITNANIMEADNLNNTLPEIAIDNSEDSDISITDNTDEVDFDSENYIFNIDIDALMAYELTKKNIKTNTVELIEVTQDIIKETPNCSVCLEDFNINDTIVKLCCNHLFHNDCLDAWLLRKSLSSTRTCPMCRTQINEYQSIIQRKSINRNSELFQLMYPFYTNSMNPFHDFYSFENMGYVDTRDRTNMVTNVGLISG